MQPTENESGCLEKRIHVRHLAQLGVSLAQGLGAAGIGGAAMTGHLERSVSAVCPRCGIVVGATDLLALAAPAAAEGELTEKQRRLRLGFCARNTCPADFYLVRLMPSSGVDWERVWSHAESALGGESAAVPALNRLSFGAALWGACRPVVAQLARRRTLGLIGLLLAFLVWRSGARIPGLSKPQRVFVVPGPSAPATPQANR